MPDLITDREMLAVLVTLEPLGTPADLEPHIRPRAHIADFDALRMSRAWSSGELVQIQVAEALWTGRPQLIDLAYVATMSGTFLSAILGGLAVYRGQALPEPSQ